MQSEGVALETKTTALDHGPEQETRSAARKLASDLNHAFRRMRQYSNQAEWAAALLDASQGFAAQSAVFTLQDGVLKLVGARGLTLPAELTFPAASGAAFKGVIESKDRVVALQTRSELTEHLSSASARSRAHLLPILNEGRVVAVLFAAREGEVDPDALELIAGLASAVLERKANAALHTRIQPAPQALQRSIASWQTLPPEKRKLHIRARRFARVAVAEMQLARPELFRAAREQGNLYLLLKREIDAARETYQKQFMSHPVMVDYLHLEFVRVAAGGDEQKLGVEYPGPLV